MARATVTQRLDELEEAGLLIRRAGAVSTGGRPPEIFEFNSEGGLFLIADLRPLKARLAVTDLDAGIRSRLDVQIDVSEGPRKVLESIVRRLALLLEEAQVDDVPIRGIGLAVPGPVEFATGQVVSPPVMKGWDRFDIPGFVASTSPWPCQVLVDNDANAMAYGEYLATDAKHPNMLTIEAGTGIGCGIVIDGRLYRGTLGSAGDLGHIPFTHPEQADPEPICKCGNRGCIEAYAGGWAIARDLHAMGHAEVRVADDLTDLLRAHDSDTLALIRSAANVLGFAISDAVSLLNPSRVVVGGLLSLADEPLIAGIRAVVYGRSRPLATRRLGSRSVSWATRPASWAWPRCSLTDCSLHAPPADIATPLRRTANRRRRGLVMYRRYQKKVIFRIDADRTVGVDCCERTGNGPHPV